MVVADTIPNLTFVMPGLVPGSMTCFAIKQDVDGRDKPGHDVDGTVSKREKSEII
jgi:hypothetical protein